MVDVSLPTLDVCEAVGLSGDCAVCGTATVWYDPIACLPFCSDGCIGAWWLKIFRYLWDGNPDAIIHDRNEAIKKFHKMKG